jgi:hypothetical protein
MYDKTHYKILKALLALFAASLLGAAPLAARAQASGAQGDNFLYRATVNDTLIGIATRYTLNANNWKTLQQINDVRDPTRLPIGFTVKIPFRLIPEVASKADVSHITGSAHADGRPLAVGDQVAEGGSVTTGDNGFVTLTLADSSVLTVPAQSTLEIKRLRSFKGTGLIDAVMSLKQGAIETNVAPKHTGVGRFEVQTPLSVTGVRGTKLRVRNSQQGAQSEVVRGTAHLQSTKRAGAATLHANQGTAVTPQGRILAVRTLLEAPALPKPERSGAGWHMAFPAVPGAAGYLVRVASDPAMANLTSRKVFSKPDVTFHASGAGRFYVAVRAIDPDGIEGNDAIRPFPGRAVLVSSNGMPVVSRFGLPILLSY